MVTRQNKNKTKEQKIERTRNTHTDQSMYQKPCHTDKRSIRQKMSKQNGMRQKVY